MGQTEYILLLCVLRNVPNVLRDLHWQQNLRVNLQVADNTFVIRWPLTDSETTTTG